MEERELFMRIVHLHCQKERKWKQSNVNLIMGKNKLNDELNFLTFIVILFF